MAHNAVLVPHSESIARVVEFKMEWQLPNFENVVTGQPIVGESLRSPVFATDVDNELGWQMRMYPWGTDIHIDDVGLYVHLVPSSRNPEVRAVFTLSIVAHRRSVATVIKKMSKIHTFVGGTSAKSSGFYDFCGQFSPRSQDGVSLELTVVCEMKMFDIRDKNEVVPFIMPEYRFPDKLRNLRENEMFRDVTVMISGQAFRAHKVILAMHSTVFSAMFEHQMAERIHNEVKITDVTPEVFNEMLRFMYTGGVIGIETIADFLLVAADKYAMDGLKVMCEEALYKNTNVENAADMLILADRHSADQLKPRVLKFIVVRTTDVMATSGFQSMIDSHPRLVAEALHVLAVSGEQNAAC